MAVKVFDFFSGCGGTSSGFAAANLEIAWGLDFDPDAAASFRRNFKEAEFVQDDIRNLPATALAPLIDGLEGPILFCGCAPCQPFSRQNRARGAKDVRTTLLSEFGRFVEFWKPEYVFVENVPGLQKVSAIDSPLHKFRSMLEKNGYYVDCKTLPSAKFGVPQKRERLMLLASSSGPIAIPDPTHGPGAKNPDYSTVREWISYLPSLTAGKAHPADSQHQAADLSALNLRRIKATPEGKGREEWPEELHLDCHKNHSGHTDVYGRLAWDRPASGLTTRCISYSNGRFGHPDQDRALSVREAARLQTFPKKFHFIGNLASRARQVGNAVPPLVAERIGQAVLAHADMFWRKPRRKRKSPVGPAELAI